MTYSVISTHELNEEELTRAPKGLKRSSVETRYSRKSEALADFEYQCYFLTRLGLNDRLELRKGQTVLVSNQTPAREVRE